MSELRGMELEMAKLQQAWLASAKAWADLQNDAARGERVDLLLAEFQGRLHELDVMLEAWWDQVPVGAKIKQTPVREGWAHKIGSAIAAVVRMRDRRGGTAMREGKQVELGRPQA